MVRVDRQREHEGRADAVKCFISPCQARKATVRGRPAVRADPGLPVGLTLGLGWLRFGRQPGTGLGRPLHHGRCLWQLGPRAVSIRSVPDFFSMGK